MTHPAAEPRTVPIRLAPGQVLRLHLDRRTTLVVAKGAVLATAPPMWIGERMFFKCTRLDEGRSLSPSGDGWMEIAATGDAPVELLRYRDAGAGLAGLLQRMRASRGVS